MEFATTETRFYVTVQNDSSAKVDFYSFDAKAVQDGSQIKDKTIYDPDNTYEIPSEILSGTKESGILFFQEAVPIEPLSLHLEITSESSYNTLNFDFAFQGV